MDSQRYARRFPTEPLHRHDMQPCCVSTPIHSLLEAEVQLHIMLHAYCRKHTADGHDWLVTTLLREHNKRNNYRSRAFLLSAHYKSTYFPKLSNTAGVSAAATPTGATNKRHTDPKLSAAKASRRRNRSSSVERESALRVRVEGVFMCWRDPAHVPALSPSPNHQALGGDWCNWAETVGPYEELWTGVKEQFGENNNNPTRRSPKPVVLLICQTCEILCVW